MGWAARLAQRRAGIRAPCSLTTALCVPTAVAPDMRTSRSWLCDRAWEPSPVPTLATPRRRRGSGRSSLAAAPRRSPLGAAAQPVGGTTWQRPPTPAPPPAEGHAARPACQAEGYRPPERPRAHSCQFACGARVRPGAARIRVAERAGALSLAGRLACGRLLGMGGR